MNDYMKLAVMSAKEGIKCREGGPFGAIIIKDNNIISCCHNTVLIDNDCTAHAEMNAIREACRVLNTYDLSDCVLYTTSEPCPMCMSAIIWANIKTVCFGNSRADAEKIGFRDKKIYDFFDGKSNIVDSKQVDNKDCVKLFDDYDDLIY